MCGIFGIYNIKEKHYFEQEKIKSGSEIAEMKFCKKLTFVLSDFFYAEGDHKQS